MTIDEMGTQTAIAETIRKRRADYVLAVKGNHGNLETDICLYFEERQVCESLKKSAGYKKTIEKTHGQTEDIRWMEGHRSWKGLKSIGLEKKTIRKKRRQRNVGII